MKTIVNIQAYADFDIPTSRQLMVPPKGMSKELVKHIVTQVASDFSRSDNVDEVVKELKSHGFTVCDSLDLTIGGEL